MMKKIRNKLKSTAGETIAEVLIALLISSLALVMLAAMINASSNMILKTQKTMNSYYEGFETLAKQSDTGNSGTIKLVMAPKAGDSSQELTFYADSGTNADFYANPVNIGGKEIMTFKVKP